MFFFSDLPEPVSAGICFLVCLHDEVVEFLIFILFFVCVLFFSVFFFQNLWSLSLNNHSVEFFWTFFPLLLLFIFSFPSIFALFSLEDFSSVFFSCSVNGMQWDWEVCCYNLFSFSGNQDLYNLLSVSSSAFDFRFMETYSSICLPVLSPVVFYISSEDVIHSFTVPSLGFNLDCVPGKSSEIFSSFLCCGVFHGHCAEICGSGHSTMPVEIFSFSSFY